MYDHHHKITDEQKDAMTALIDNGFEVVVLSGKLLFCDQDEIIKISTQQIPPGEEEAAEYKSALKLYNYYKNKGLIN